MLVSRLEGIARQCGLTSVQAGSVEQAIEKSGGDCGLAFVDLQLPGLQIADAVQQLRESVPGIAIIACGPHVHTERLAAATQAGCEAVVSRGQFDRDGATIVGALVNNPG